MKRNIKRTMDRLEIDEGIRDLVRQLWKHNYRTIHSCQGHPEKKHAEQYVSFRRESGDGWFEQNAERLGFRRLYNYNCCSINEFGFGHGLRIGCGQRTINRKTVSVEKQYCGNCGAGINGVVAYTG